MHRGDFYSATKNYLLFACSNGGLFETQAALAQKLTTMQLQEWIALIKLITVESFADILYSM